MAEHASSTRLVDIIEAIELINAEMAGITLAAFEADKRKRWLVERGIEIISEASRHLGDELKARHPGIAWSKMAGIGSATTTTGLPTTCSGTLSATTFRRSNRFAGTNSPVNAERGRSPAAPCRTESNSALFRARRGAVGAVLKAATRALHPPVRPGIDGVEYRAIRRACVNDARAHAQ
jgi:hypothetical protein